MENIKSCNRKLTLDWDLGSRSDRLGVCNIPNMEITALQQNPMLSSTK